ncbi:MAG: YceI family protein [Crocinitomicaceae bacterium]|nr:YceI family protein [Crocinitomicaceae bacterium]
MKKILLSFVIAMISMTSIAQLTTKDAFVSFYSKMDDVTAENTSVKSTLDPKTGDISFTVSISAFSFANKTMQEHFNQEGVMNSAEFPIAKYEGTIVNNAEVDYTADGSYDVKVNGTMTIKGVTKEFSATGKIVIEGGKIIAKSSFDLDRFEFGVNAKEKSISKILAINVEAKY